MSASEFYTKRSKKKVKRTKGSFMILLNSLKLGWVVVE